MTRVLTVATMVQHYLQRHAAGSTLDDVADLLREKTGRGSAQSISAWAKGHRAPAVKQIRALRSIVRCACPEYSDNAITALYDRAAKAAPAKAAKRRAVPLQVHLPTVRTRAKQHVVGRDDEVRDFAELRAGHHPQRLLNIYGPGGIGKSEVFHKFVAFGRDGSVPLGHADIADIRYAGGEHPFGATEILRALAATLRRAELDPFLRQLHDYDTAMAAVRAVGGVEHLVGVRALEALAPGATSSPQLQAALSNRLAFERYRRGATAALTSTFCEGLAAVAESGDGAPTLLLDTYEEIAEHDDWICRDVVPNLPEQARLVIFGRHLLTRSNVDWADHQDSLRARQLPELSENDAKSYLRNFGLTEAVALQGVYAVTGGYPLLLVLARTLAMESGGWAAIGELDRDRDRDTIASGLLDRILREERLRNIRHVLETCSIAPWIEPGVIGALLAVSAADAHALYTELSMHSLVSRHPRGVVLHDKIKELLQVRLRFAGAARYQQISTALSNYLSARGGLVDA